MSDIKTSINSGSVSLRAKDRGVEVAYSIRRKKKNFDYDYENTHKEEAFGPDELDKAFDRFLELTGIKRSKVIPA